MLPFLKKHKAAGLIVEQRMPDKPSEISEMETCAQDLLSAIEAKDIKGMASALQAAFELADSQPHQEGEHLDEQDSE